MTTLTEDLAAEKLQRMTNEQTEREMVTSISLHPDGDLQQQVAVLIDPDAFDREKGAVGWDEPGGQASKDRRLAAKSKANQVIHAVRTAALDSGAVSQDSEATAAADPVEQLDWLEMELKAWRAWEEAPRDFGRRIRAALRAPQRDGGAVSREQMLQLVEDSAREQRMYPDKQLDAAAMLEAFFAARPYLRAPQQPSSEQELLERAEEKLAGCYVEKASADGDPLLIEIRAFLASRQEKKDE